MYYGVDHLIFDLWSLRGEWKIWEKNFLQIKAFTVKETHATRMAITKMHAQFQNELHAPLAVRKKVLALTNSSTLPLRSSIVPLLVINLS